MVQSAGKVNAKGTSLCRTDFLQAITTKGGSLVITMSETNTHQLNFQSGESCHVYIASWNQGLILHRDAAVVEPTMLHDRVC